MNSTSRLASLIAIILTMAATSGGVVSSSANISRIKREAWLLKQESCTVGLISLIVSDTAVKWSCPKIGLTLIMRAPNWDVVGYNESTKKYMQLTPAQAQQLFGKHDALTEKIKSLKNGPERRDAGLEPLKSKQTICGHPTLEYHIPKKYSSAGHNSFTQSSSDYGNTKQVAPKSKQVYDPKLWSPGDEDCWFAADINFPEPVVRSFSLQHVNGMHPALRSVHIGLGGSNSVAFDTVECKKIPISATMFELPKGLVRTDNEMALMMDMSDSDLDMFAPPERKSTKSVNP